ncbi:MAG: NYN domain-containing protein [Gloeomargaritaceae cyanobacterium C42_A2020_066]|nr:NYN domain-containing protein [Gloeomargaritaceae cyanobacterium C42_A2020_066]
MRFDTVILYDIENLTKGYSFNRKIEQGLSLKEITKNVESLDIVKNVAIKRAYANWSDLRLKFLRNEILELGIEPIQLFGFSANQGKNAADIQLAIDAMDIVHTRLFVNVFVIISGDGAFSALAKKLHEYGKVVIGGAYQNATSKVFEAVCDYFISIEDPDCESDIITDKNEINPPRNIQSTKQEFQNLRQITPLNCLTSNREDILSKAKETIGLILSDSRWRNTLRTGISPSVFKEVFSLVLQNMTPQRLGFQKFAQLLRCFFRDTELCLYSKPPSDVKVGLRFQPIQGYEILSDLESGDPHSPAVYRSLLAEPLPVQYLPSYEVLARICSELAAHPLDQETLQGAIERLSASLHANLPEKTVKSVLQLLQSADLIVKDPQDSASAKTFLSSPNSSHEMMMEGVLKYLLDKIQSLIGEEPRREVLILSLEEPNPSLGNQDFT